MTRTRSVLSSSALCFVLLAGASLSAQEATAHDAAGPELDVSWQKGPATGDLGGLNPAGAPARDAFVRVRADFEYDRIVEGAVGPFARIDEVTIPIRFNG